MNRKPLHSITDADRETYERDGVVVLRGMFDDDWARRMREACERNYRNREVRGKDHTVEGDTGYFRTNLFMWRYDEDFRDFVFNSPAAEIVGQLLGVDQVHFFYDQLFVKEPGTQAATKWHQDLPFWPMQGSQIPSVWMALTSLGKDESGLEHIAGSHKWGKFYSAELSNAPKDLGDGPREVCPDYSLMRDDPKLRFVSPTFEPGDVVVHHPLTIHGSTGNLSSTKTRIALSTRWLGRDCSWDRRPYTMVIEGGEPDLQKGQAPFCDQFPLAWTREPEDAAQQAA